MRPTKVGEVTAVERTGDDDALTYGGGVIFRKDCDTFWQFWDAPSAKVYLAWTAKVPAHVLRAYKSIDRDELAFHVGVDTDLLRTMSTSGKPLDRVRLLEGIMTLEGRSRVCPRGPEELTRHEMVQRWGPLYSVDPESMPQYDADDFMVLEFEEGFGCGQIAGRFLGVYETFEQCATAIAEDMQATGRASLVFVENDDGEIERLEWTRSKWVGLPANRIRMGFASSTWRFRMRPHAKEARKKPRRLSRAEGLKRRIRGTMRKPRT